MSLTPFQRSCLHHPATSSRKSITEYGTNSQFPYFILFYFSLFSSSDILGDEALEFPSEKLKELEGECSFFFFFLGVTGSGQLGNDISLIYRGIIKK